MEPLSNGRLVIALAVLAFLAGLVWRTMEPGKYQQFTWLLLGFFALRVLLSWLGSRKIKAGSAGPSQEPDL